MSPFDRYKKMIAYLESEEKKSDKDKEKEALKDTEKLLDEVINTA